MGNGSIHPDEKKLKEKVGEENYITENPPKGSRIIGEEQSEPTEVEETQKE